MNVKVGSAPAAWGVERAQDPLQTPWQRFLDEVAEAGYEWIELGPPGYLPTQPAQLRRELETRHLKAAGGFVMPHIEDPLAWPEIEQSVWAVGAQLAELGAKHLLLMDNLYSLLPAHIPTRAPALGSETWKILVEATHKTARLAHEKFGLRLVFHPHTETHVEYEPQIEQLLAETDPAWVGLCLDTGHHAYRGGDPVAFIQKHHQRLEYLHLKNIEPRKLAEINARDVSLAVATAEGIFCEPAIGVVDFRRLHDILEHMNYQGFAIVEQDMYPAPFDKPLPIARRTRAYLYDIGLG
jgi:inosose dehydratase